MNRRRLILYFTDIHRKYRNTVRLHIGWLNANEKPVKMVENIVSSYNAILKEMKTALIANMVKYDIRSMTTAVLFLFHVGRTNIGCDNFKIHTLKKLTGSKIFRTNVTS